LKTRSGVAGIKNETVTRRDGANPSLIPATSLAQHIIRMFCAFSFLFKKWING
jgi:hypothetical protein